MRTKKKTKKGAGRPRLSIKEAREFGRQVEAAMKTGLMQARAFEYVRRLDPDRWGSVRKHYRLWKMYREDKARDMEVEHEAWLKQLYVMRAGLEKPDPAIDDTIAWLTAVIEVKPRPPTTRGLRIPTAWFFRWQEQYYPKPN